MRRAAVVVLLALAVGCGKIGSGSSAKAPSPKTHLNDPVDTKAFEAAILGRSTREVTELLGPPEQTLNGSPGLGWVYRTERKASVILMFKNDRVVQVDWGLK